MFHGKWNMSKTFCGCKPSKKHWASSELLAPIKKKHTIIGEMSWCNLLRWYHVLRRAGADFCVNDNFPGTVLDFRLKIFTQERISIYVDTCP